ncbi:hypothetical protein M9H77_31362 [Catharanthus roseus]|uniref:Uncharacterized protein n=1 Tax=Catharanthus roseus TaxID=4058 RepID=A0ACB9ZZW0_CATRO|nr:hypothetical protein M9H77_31362 [Catharanthus roseus]
MASQGLTEPLTNSSKTNMSNQTVLARLANLIKLLPTGTVFLYQFAVPLLTNSGKCNPTNKIVSAIFIGVCGLSCFISTFTDSYTDKDGKIHCGIATFKGFWPSSDSNSIDLSKYKLRIGDFFHAFLALVVFGVIVLFDGYTVQCFYPSLQLNQKALLMSLPPCVGGVASTVFAFFPDKRHGIGYLQAQVSAKVIPEQKA